MDLRHVLQLWVTNLGFVVSCFFVMTRLGMRQGLPGRVELGLGSRGSILRCRGGRGEGWSWLETKKKLENVAG